MNTHICFSCGHAYHHSYVPADAGWLGETYDTGAPQNNEGRIGMKVLSWEPRIFLYHNFLTDGMGMLLLPTLSCN